LYIRLLDQHANNPSTAIGAFQSRAGLPNWNHPMEIRSGANGQSRA
jgi:hypothetical protein